jgi:hypothetical protein
MKTNRDWQRPLLQEDERDVPLKVWEVLLYGAMFAVFVIVGLVKIGG